MNDSSCPRCGFEMRFPYPEHGGCQQIVCPICDYREIVPTRQQPRSFWDVALISFIFGVLASLITQLFTR